MKSELPNEPGDTLNRVPLRKKEVHPVTDPVLHAQAERAALAAYEAANAAKETPERRMRLMDKAGRDVFKKAGVVRDVANFYAACVTALVLERIHHRLK
jgi:hypothetical protein